MSAPQAGDTNVRGYVLPDGAVCALGDPTPAYHYDPYRLYSTEDFGFPDRMPALTEILFDVAAFAVSGELYAYNVRRA
jgi:hypothetical protein